MPAKKKTAVQTEQLRQEINALRLQLSSLQKVRQGRRRTEQALSESLEIYQTLIETSPCAVLFADMQGTIIMVNQEMVRHCGGQKSVQFIGRKVSTLFVAADRSVVQKALGKVRRQRLMRNLELRMQRSDKEAFPVELSISTINNEHRRPDAYMLVFSDLSGLKQAQRRQQLSEAQYRLLVDHIPDYIVETDMDDTVLYANAGWRSLQGAAAGASFLQTVPEDAQSTIGKMRNRAIRTAKVCEYECSFSRDGEYVCWSGRVIPIKESAQSRKLLHLIRDVTHQKQVERLSQRKAAFESLIADLSTKCNNLKSDTLDRGINDALRRIGEFAGTDRSYIFQFRTKQRVMSNTHEWCASGVKPYLEQLQEIPLTKFSWIVRRIKKGEIVYVPTLGSLPASAAAEKKEFVREQIKSLINVPMTYMGTVVGFLGCDAVRQSREWPEEIRMLLRVAADLLAASLQRTAMEQQLAALNKELVQTNAKLKQLALRDPLTGLYNHRYFQDVIESEFDRARRQADPLSIIMLDLDYFKSINDVYGHHFGDVVLKQLSRQLLQMVRKYDTVVRFGGEEFIIITPGADRKIARILAQRLLDVIKLQNYGDDHHKVKLKVSVAVASYSEDPIRRSRDFLKIADFVLNKVKESGGDKVYTYADMKAQGKVIEKAAEDEADVAHLKEKLDKLTRRSNESLAEAIFAFAKTIEIKDHYTGEHVERTVYYATEIAKSMQLSDADTERIRQAALLHDLGKIGITERILLKKSKLTAKEYDEIKKHPQIGVDILRPIHFFQGILPLILHHHERWDGNGYPFGLKGEEIPLGARIIAVADTFESLTADRCYRKAQPRLRSIQIVEENAGTQFDPQIVSHFLDVLRAEELQK